MFLQHMRNSELIVIMPLAAFLVSCTTPTVDYYPVTGSSKNYLVSANFYAMDEYKNYLCSQKEPGCIKKLQSLVQELINSDTQLSTRCGSGFVLDVNSIMVDENATTYAEFHCN